MPLSCPTLTLLQRRPATAEPKGRFDSTRKRVRVATVGHQTSVKCTAPLCYKAEQLHRAANGDAPSFWIKSRGALIGRGSEERGASDFRVQTSAVKRVTVCSAMQLNPFKVASACACGRIAVAVHIMPTRHCTQASTILRRPSHRSFLPPPPPFKANSHSKQPSTQSNSNTRIHARCHQTKLLS